MTNKLLAKEHQKSSKKLLNPFRSISLVLLIGLAIGCNSKTNELIRDCNEGVEDACKEIYSKEWAKSK